MKTHFVIAVALALAASNVAAQKMFKSVMPDGRVIYSEKPQPGAKSVDTIEAPPSQSGVSVVTPQEKQRADQLKRQSAIQAKGDATALGEARKQLQQAEAARDAAAVQKEGDRIGTAKGGSRLTEDYLARQKQAEANVEAARKRVQDLERGR